MHDAQAEQKVGAKRAVAHRLLQVAVGGGDDADVRLLLAHAAEAPHRPVFEQLQQLDLHPRVDVADLVEEQRAAGGRLDQAELALLRVGERAALVAEELRLEQIARDRRAVELDERRVPAPAVEVQRARDQLLAGSGLAGDQHRGQLGIVEFRLGREQLADRGLQRQHRFRGADQLVEPALGGDLPAVVGELLVALLVADELVEAQLQLAQDDRLDEVVVRARLHRIDGDLLAAVAGHQDHGNARIDRLDALQHVDAVHPRQRVVEHHRLGPQRLELGEPVFAARRDTRVPALTLEIGRDVLGERELVVDDEDRGGHFTWSGREARRRPPPPSPLRSRWTPTRRSG